MAASRRLLNTLHFRSIRYLRFYSAKAFQEPRSSFKRLWIWSSVASGVCIGSCLVLYKSNPHRSLLPQIEANDTITEDKEKKTGRRSTREIMYGDFASVMYNGEMYMTPRDFLESLTQDEPRDHSFQVMDDRMIRNALKSVPSLSKGSSFFFRTLWNNGILTYADYLFLINALIKPIRQFEILFKMIDVDGSNTIDIEEFQRMQKSITRKRENQRLQDGSDITQSSLIVHLFGPKGNKKLASNDLFQFIDNLQIEIRQMEFQKYSLGGPTISPHQFAEILLRHTNYDMQDVSERLHSEPNLAAQGITFQQYNDFCQLLNALDDLAISMTMYTIAGQAVSEDEFARAAKVTTGKSLDPTVVHTVFKIFDVDGDGKLSHKEFLSVMKNWQVNNMKMKQTKREGIWSEFKTCVKLEMRNRSS